jgi:hypothetical protein
MNKREADKVRRRLLEAIESGDRQKAADIFKEVPKAAKHWTPDQTKELVGKVHKVCGPHEAPANNCRDFVDALQLTETLSSFIQFGVENPTVDPFSGSDYPESGRGTGFLEGVVLVLCHEIGATRAVNQGLRHEVDALKRMVVELSNTVYDCLLKQERPEDDAD